MLSFLNNGADDLVSRNQERFRFGKFSVPNMQIRTADAAGPHPNQHLV
jgi:hypothetical protein